jgi:hypothetical protein
VFTLLRVPGYSICIATIKSSSSSSREEVVVAVATAVAVALEDFSPILLSLAIRNMQAQR